MQTTLYPARIPGAICGCLFLKLLLSLVTASAQSSGTNYWTKPTSGSWEEPFWSLGVLPNSSQPVVIANPGWKAVAINPSTPVDFPDSMTVGSLDVSGPTDTVNTLLLNFTGTTPPLRVLNDCNVEPNGRLVMIESGLRVDGALNLQGVLDQAGG